MIDTIKALCFTLLLTSLLTSCGFDDLKATITGNPKGSDSIGSNGPSDAPFEVQYPSDELLQLICQRVEECSDPPVTFSGCVSEVQTASGIGTFLGLQDPTISSLSDIRAAEADGRLVADRTAMDKCLADIKGRNCDQALDANGAIVIPGGAGSCPEIY